MVKMAKWRRHTVEFKRQAVERMKTCENIEALARELKIQRKLLYNGALARIPCDAARSHAARPAAEQSVVRLPAPGGLSQMSAG